MSSLVLLSTFPGWPTVVDPSPWFYFMLLLGGPLLVSLVIGGLGLGLGSRRKVDEINRAAGLAGTPATRTEVEPARTPVVEPAHASVSETTTDDEAGVRPMRRALPDEGSASGAHVAH